jgi:hypothetical protein
MKISFINNFLKIIDYKISYKNILIKKLRQK